MAKWGKIGHSSSTEVLLERRISNLKQSAGKDEHFDKKKIIHFPAAIFL